MLELLTTNLELILTAIGLIGGTGFISIRATKKKAEAQAMRAVQEVYQETIKDLREDKSEMKKENDEFRRSLKDLRNKVLELSKELASIRKYKCTVVNCDMRTQE